MNANISSRSKTIKQMAISGICLALCMLLPFLTGQIPQIGNAISPMHIPVLICGFACGSYYAAIIGIIAPLLRYALFGMPPVIPVGLAMCVELAVYGAASGLLYRLLPKKIINIYITLIAAMLVGRIFWGITSVVIFGVANSQFTFKLFITSAFVNALPGIIIHIALIPLVVIALKKANLLIE